MIGTRAVLGRSLASSPGASASVQLVGEMVIARVITSPVPLVLGWTMFELTRLPGAAAYPAVGSVLLVGFGWVAWAMSPIEGYGTVA